MPSAYTYPGVYVEEIPSGVRTIAGVSTSDTAFVDFFPRGPVRRAVRVAGFADFARVFGGVHNQSEASYALQQYFLNGGSVAWVVRVTNGDANASHATLASGYPSHANTLRVEAANPGVWGDGLRVAVTHVDRNPDLFNLVVQEVSPVGGKLQVVNNETFLNLSMDRNGTRYAPDVVNVESALVRVSDEGLGERPDRSPADAKGNLTFTPLADGTDGDAPDADALVSEEPDPADRKRPLGGVYALDRIQPFVFNLLCLPAAANLNVPAMKDVITKAQAYCEAKRAFFLVDIPESVDSADEMIDWMQTNEIPRHRNSAVYFPRLLMPDPLNENRPANVGPSGTLAGIYARTDASRGVWKAPAGTEATIRGASLAVKIDDPQNGALNPLGFNALRNFPIFLNVSWGARTLEGADQQASEWKYVPVRRTALYIEESLYQGLKWVVFEPNDEPLWSQIRLNVGAFMNTLFRQGAFQGSTPDAAYFVRCDGETTTQNDIDRGIVNVLVGFAPLKPAEFVVLKIQQIAGKIES